MCRHNRIIPFHPFLLFIVCCCHNIISSQGHRRFILPCHMTLISFKFIHSLECSKRKNLYHNTIIPIINNLKDRHEAALRSICAAKQLGSLFQEAAWQLKSFGWLTLVQHCCPLLPPTQDESRLWRCECAHAGGKMLMISLKMWALQSACKSPRVDPSPCYFGLAHFQNALKNALKTKWCWHCSQINRVMGQRCHEICSFPVSCLLFQIRFCQGDSRHLSTQVRTPMNTSVLWLFLLFWFYSKLTASTYPDSNRCNH